MVLWVFLHIVRKLFYKSNLIKAFVKGFSALSFTDLALRKKTSTQKL